jgi:DNA-nicking Smr family endonuclease
MAHRERLRGAGETGGDEDESALFQQAVADARRLAADVHVPAISYRAPVALSDHEREVLRELDALVSGETPFALVEGDEYHEGRASGVDPRVVRRLHRGEFSIQAELDLHGVDAQSAHALVDRLCADAHARGLRVVKIVHGRGRNSPGGEAVLRPSLPRWLSRGPTGKLVLAWSTAPQTDGGAGATYVLLRRERHRRGGSDPVS